VPGTCGLRRRAHCFIPTNASWANPIEAQFGPLRTFVMGSSDYPNHAVLARKLQAYLAWHRLRHGDRSWTARPSCSLI
jgi:hypothetical protein